MDDSEKDEEFDLMKGFVEEEPQAPIARVTRIKSDDLKKFIQDFSEGKIFSSAHMTESELRNLPMVFLPLALGALSHYAEEETKNIGIIWEYLASAGPRSINGLPIFFSCHIMHKDDWAIAVEKLKKLEKTKKALLKVIDD